MLVFFFFQAEDGIRDKLVTGVQTCALPIYLVLPVVRRALAINPQLKIMASPWSPPGWMKTSGSLIQGTLLPEAYGPFAEYFRRYVAAFGAVSVPIYAITVQNEPHYEPSDYPGMRLEPPARARLVGGYFAPLFAPNRV